MITPNTTPPSQASLTPIAPAPSANGSQQSAPAPSALTQAIKQASAAVAAPAPALAPAPAPAQPPEVKQAAAAATAPAPTQQPSVTEPDLSQAYQQASQLLMQSAYGQPFFQKLASDYGIAPETAEEADYLIRLATECRAKRQAELQKHAADRTSVVQQALASLNPALAIQNNNHVKAAQIAAPQWASDQRIRDAALLYADALKQLEAA